jgi:hypothetical protein
LGLKSVKLYICEDQPNETIIESFQAKEWDDFVLITFSGDPRLIDMEGISETLNQTFKDKKILLMPEELNLKFYGVREEQDEG